DADISPPVKYLYAKADETIARLKDIKVACKKGCSHCCHVWVSASAPEILYVAKQIRRRVGAADRVRAAHAVTGGFTYSIRALHPNPCPMLNDDACSIYEHRPMACRFAASPDDFACRRVMIELVREPVKMAPWHMRGRGGYEMAMVIALHRAELPH